MDVKTNKKNILKNIYVYGTNDEKIKKMIKNDIKFIFNNLTTDMLLDAINKTINMLKINKNENHLITIWLELKNTDNDLEIFIYSSGYYKIFYKSINNFQKIIRKYFLRKKYEI